ncbi:MAG: malate synthase A [Planctomycetota bacterium]|jgi:malate synthase
MSGSIVLAEGIELKGPLSPGFEAILTPAALEFVARLSRRFAGRRDRLLEGRRARQEEIDAGVLPDFLPQTEEIRRATWTVAPVPADLADRRVEITGPADRKMVINALNSGAMVFMADFEDSSSPTWENCVRGQLNLCDAVRRTIEFVAPSGKHYWLEEDTATLMVRPRGWHLDERHLLVDGRPVPAGLFDFGLFFFHNARELMARGTGPYLYLPKLQDHLEARLWNDIFVLAQQELGIPRGTIKATVLIEHILAAFEMDEILYELREHAAGLNCGRWDYIFSFIRTFRNYPEFVLPDRAAVGMTCHFLRSYSLLLIDTCHRRGAHAMGGMAAQIPIKHNPVASQLALSRVRADKEREVGDGHDGTWVAHPGLVPVAMEVFDRRMKRPHQRHRRRFDHSVAAADLLRVPQGRITEAGLQTNVSVGLRYLEAWLRGTGCVPIHHLMEDAATVEISRAQLWQWIRHDRGILDDGRCVTAELVRAAIRDELDRLRAELGEDAYRASQFLLAASLFEGIVTAGEFTEFLTLSAYAHI